MGKLLLVMERRPEPASVLEVPAVALWTAKSPARRRKPSPPGLPRLLAPNIMSTVPGSPAAPIVREGEVLPGPVAGFFEDGQLKKLSIYAGVSSLTPITNCFSSTTVP